MPANQQSTFNPWLVVDVVGSPTLTRLIGALTIDACEDIPSLDLSVPYSEEREADNDAMNIDEGGCSIVCVEAQDLNRQNTPVTSHSVSFGIAALSTSIGKPSPPWMPGPLDELYPFPKSARESCLSTCPRTDHLVTSTSLKAKELECTIIFKSLKSMQPSEINSLAEDMRSIAWRYEELEQYRQAEVWYRRVVTSFSKIRAYQPFKLLYACLAVVDNVRFQDRYKEAASLHGDVHQKILELCGVDDDLAMKSRGALANLWYESANDESALAIYRELLQIALLRFGVRHERTLSFLLALGDALERCGLRREAHALLCIRIQLDCELSSRTERNIENLRDALGAMTSLGRCLNKQGRYADGRNVLDCAAERFKNIIQIESPSCTYYFYQRATALRLEGYLSESEEILRAVLRHTPDHSNYNRTVLMGELADILMRTGGEAEAVTLREKAFLAEVETFGLEHKYSRWSCRELGFCYTRLGRYDDAIKLFKQTIEKVALGTFADDEDRDWYTKQLQSWTIKVENMKRKTQNVSQ